MQPEKDVALVQALTDASRESLPRAWQAATEASAEELSTTFFRSAVSARHRARRYQVGHAFRSQRPLSKLFDLPETADEQSVLRAMGALDLFTTEPSAIASDRPIVLHACVIVTCGARRATLADTQRGELFLVPLRLGQLFESQRGASLAELLELHGDLDAAWLERWFGVLLAAELATVLDEPYEAFPPIEPLPASPSFLDHVVLDVGPDSEHDLEALVEELDELGCDHLQLRFLRPISPDELRVYVAATSTSRLRSIELVAPWSPAWTQESIDRVTADIPRLASLVLHGAPEHRSFAGKGYEAVLLTQALTDHRGCGRVHPGYFSTSVEAALLSRTCDTCLSGKIGIDVEGGIRNCPTHPSRFGRLGVDRLGAVIADPAFVEPWALVKGDVEDCRICEFRSVCSHCQVQAAAPGRKPGSCRYDPRSARWRS